MKKIMRSMTDFEKGVIMMNIVADALHCALTSAIVADVFGLHLNNWSDLLRVVFYCGIPAFVVFAGLAVVMIKFYANGDECNEAFFAIPYVIESLALAIMLVIVNGDVGQALECFGAGLVHALITIILKSIFFIFVME